MNRVQISGVIATDPVYRTHELTDVTVALFTLACGSENRTVAVYARRASVQDLRQFSAGDSVAVDGGLAWNGDKLEILAEEIRKWKHSVHRPGNPPQEVTARVHQR